MTLPVRFSPAALADLEAIYDHIAQAGFPDRGAAFVERIHALCLSLAEFPARGAPREDIRPGLRVLTHRRRTSIAYVARGDITILRVLHAGQAWDV